MNPIDMLREFHNIFNHPISVVPGLPDLDEQKLRLDLLEEEYTEYKDAVSQGDIVEIADALADMVYIIYGTALVYGIDLKSVLEEVHRSNMDKLDQDGKPIYYPNGKVKKPQDWTPPDIKGILNIS